jgi:hypothetical protein
MTELEALQNAAKDLGLTIYEHNTTDKRRTVKKYFAAEEIGNAKTSPVLDYDQLNHFLLGYRSALKNMMPI